MAGLGCHGGFSWHLLVACLLPVAVALRYAEQHDDRVAARVKDLEKQEPDADVMNTLKAALDVRKKIRQFKDGSLPGLVPNFLADKVAQLAANEFGRYPATLHSTEGAKASGGANLQPKADAEPEKLVRRVAKPPVCPKALPALTKEDLGLALAPFKPEGRLQEEAKQLADGGLAWPLKNDGWYFQYPDMILRKLKNGMTNIRWTDPPYAVDYDANGITYYTGRSKVHRTINNDVMFQDPSGIVRQEGDSIIYHWCDPNAVVYMTPIGTAYYDDGGITFRSGNGLDVSHYAATGEVLYQGTGGITKHSATGEVTHWTASGAVYQHKDGTLTYTPVGEKTSRPLETGVRLGRDPFPNDGKALTEDDLPGSSLDSEVSKKLAAAITKAFVQ